MICDVTQIKCDMTRDVSVIPVTCWVFPSQAATNFTATHCDTMQHIATHCNALHNTDTTHGHHAACFHALSLQRFLDSTDTQYNTPQHTATPRHALHHTATHLQHAARFHVLALYARAIARPFFRCDTLQHTARHRDTLQHIVTHCNALHHIATHLQHAAHFHVLSLERVFDFAHNHRGNSPIIGWQ